MTEARDPHTVPTGLPRVLWLPALVALALIVFTDDRIGRARADQVVILDAGRVVERGPSRAVLTRPRSTFAARLAGLNLVRNRHDVRIVG